MKVIKTKLWIGETFTWGALSLLSIASYILFESNANQANQHVIISLMVAKFILVYLFFMRMKSSSWQWHIITGTYLLTIIIFTWL